MAYINGKKVLSVVRTETIDATAQDIAYTNTTSGLDATNVQDAVDQTLDIANKLAQECDYTTNAIITGQNLGLDVLVVETFKDVTNIDQTLLNGATVVTDYWKENKHAIIKTSSDTLSIESTLFTVDGTPYNAWCSLDFTGSGSINIYLSKNNGTDWTQLTPGTLNRLNALVQKQIRIKLDLVGVVTLKNLSWGVM